MVLVGASESGQMTSVDNLAPSPRHGAALVSGGIGIGEVNIFLENHVSTDIDMSRRTGNLHLSRQTDQPFPAAGI